LELGIHLPLMEFGDEGLSLARLTRAVDAARECGFASVSANDHFLFGTPWLDGPAALAAVVERSGAMELATTVALVSLRGPVQLAKTLAALDVLSGGRVIAGMGLGFNPAELATVGLRIEDRVEILRETVEIARLIWKENNASYRGEIFSFEDVTIEPKPVEPIPIFCGGSTRAAIRRAAEYCDGWIPGRVPMATFDDRINYLRQLTDRKITLGNIPITRIDKDRKKARASIDVEALAESSEGSGHWIKPPSGKFQTIEDLEGLLIVGNPDDCAAEIEKFRARDVEHLVFDLRLQYDRFEESLELIGKELLPRFQDS